MSREVEIREIESVLNRLLDKREKLYLKGGNDERLNSKIREQQSLLRIISKNKY